MFCMYVSGKIRCLAGGGDGGGGATADWVRGGSYEVEVMGERFKVGLFF